ncbi:hypothetical protein [uncultured Hyphomicrobium sp.]|uniref:hypothetical protein n=1 Tax=uncultured Hyphomicrobium sp. TaxID=194373 RepID=UPI0025DCC6AA|nr:hypothetical protein [uncultured Hyphomicrobium sp.]
MRTLVNLALPILLLAGLTGCGETLANFDLVGSVTETKTDGSSTVTQGSASTADPRDAICAWAEAAGIPTLQFATLDSAATKRQGASILGAYNVTCKKPETVAPAAAPAQQKAPAPTAKKAVPVPLATKAKS